MAGEGNREGTRGEIEEGTGLFSLPEIGVGSSLALVRKGSRLAGRDALDAAARELSEGRIVAIKGAGGFHFACSPYDESAADALRLLKGREKKPFAVMFRGIDQVAEFCEVGGGERELLLSPSRPIVLLRVKSAAFAPGVLKGNERCGCFLPYTALHAGLFRELGALVMTSANRSGSAILVDDGEVLRFLAESGCPRFSSVLLHDHIIQRQLEDSVAQIADGEPQILRWSRGYAPSVIPLENRGGDLLAMGGDLKAAFCLVKGERAYRSQYFGDLEEKSVFDRYAAGIQDFTRLFGASPSRVVCDLHPGYHSAALAEGMGLPLLRVQHHHAHVASVMAEHGLERAIGVAFDGTGYGDDGLVWGGEFLVCDGDGDGYNRAGHLGYVGLVGGDSAARDAGRTALCYLCADGNEPPEDVGYLCEEVELLRAAIKSGVNLSRSSSMGRLFDAVAAILGVASRNNYEGECAIRLQQAAESALKNGLRPHPLRFRLDGGLIPDAAGLCREIFSLRKEVDAASLALGFHMAVAELTREVCALLAEREHCGRVALSGGVFQNRLLLELTSERLRGEKLMVYTNRESPPNDGGIALGQAFVGGKRTCV